MLTLLKINNIALIDQLELEFGPGLNLLTGETGSGKSIIVDSLSIRICVNVDDFRSSRFSLLQTDSGFASLN